ncbi:MULTISPECIES: hypothetical protein [Niallia]|uniref:hypothetical protein n=1 Tax=Niallia TaxID=2837506 RepID=UPI00149035D6|nr:hypothetical protein [Niallia circulans]QJX61548.1 hypothetical protein HLK66_07715 [Niallia circulans]
MFFRKMSNSEEANWRKGAIAGFYVYLLLLFVNYTSSLFFQKEPFSTTVIFWSGLLVAFGLDFILNLLSRKNK